MYFARLLFMAQDDEFIIGGRKKRRSGSQGSPRTGTSRGGGSVDAGLVRLGKMPGGSFTARMRKELSIAKRSSGRKSYHKPSKPRTGRFNARGRGRAALAAGIGPNRSWQTFNGDSIRYRSRRAVVKVRVMKLRGQNTRAAYSHLKYLQRDGAGVEKSEDERGDLKLTETRGELYGPDRDLEYNDRDFLERTEASFDGRGDPHQFRLILSPEDGVELARDVFGGPPNMQRQTRELMTQMETDLETKLDWVAVDHFDTAHPHTHVVLRGITDDGKGLNIAGDYIAQGIRGRYEHILTHELGLKCEMDILEDLRRHVDKNRVTVLDKAILPRIDVDTSVIDLRPGTFYMHKDSAINRHLLIGRMKHLETLGLAQATDKGRWQVERHAFDTLESLHRHEIITRDMSAAMERANIDRMMQLHGREAPQGKITGRVIGKGLAEDESSGKMRLIVDGDDGYVHAVETGAETRASEARIGSVVEIGQARLRAVDKTLLDYGERTGVYDSREHLYDVEKLPRYGKDSDKALVHVGVHKRRAQALVKAGAARVYMQDDSGEAFSWKLESGFKEKILALDSERGRGAGLRLLSLHSLEAQLKSPGATWIDRVQFSFHKGGIGKEGYGKDLHRAYARRQQWLIDQGLAQESGANVSYQKGYVQTLIDREVGAQAAKIAKETGKSYRAAQPGMRVEGVYTDRLELSSGPHAVLETQRAFYLVPWRSVMEQERGRRLSGTMGARTIDWELGRNRGKGLGR